MSSATKLKATRTHDNATNTNTNTTTATKRGCYPPKPQSNSNNAICNLIDIINDNNLHSFYERSSLSGDVQFKHNIDQLNLKFYLETEKILSSPSPSSTEQLEHQNKLFLILFKQINLYIKEIERLNTLLREAPGNAEGIRKRMEIITKQKDDFETKELIIQSLKHSVESLEQKLLKCIISENALREENEKLKQELRLYKHSDSPFYNKHNLTTSKTRTYSSDHQHTHVNANAPMNLINFNEFDANCNAVAGDNSSKDGKLLSQRLSSRSPINNKNVNKKILNFNLNNNRHTTKTLYNGSACNSNSSSNKKMKIIKEVKHKFAVLNKNKSVNAFVGCVTTTNNIASFDNALLPKSPRVNGFNIKQRLVNQHKQTNVSPSNSCSVSMNNGKAGSNNVMNVNNTNNNRNASNEKEITKIENLLIEIKDHYNNENTPIASEHLVQSTAKPNSPPDHEHEPQQTYFQYTHASLQGRAVSNGGAYG